MSARFKYLDVSYQKTEISTLFNYFSVSRHLFADTRNLTPET